MSFDDVRQPTAANTWDTPAYPLPNLSSPWHPQQAPSPIGTPWLPQSGADQGTVGNATPAGEGPDLQRQSNLPSQNPFPLNPAEMAPPNWQNAQTGAIDDGLPILNLRPEQQKPTDVLPSWQATKDVYDKVAPSTVEVLFSEQGSSGRGSGFFVNNNGDVLTDGHVVDAFPTTLKVRTLDGHEYPAEVVKYDADHDLALLRTKVPAQEITPATLADQPPQHGDPVFSMGSPVESDEGNPLGLHFAISPGFYDRTGTWRDALHGYQAVAKFNLLSKTELQQYQHDMDIPLEAGRVNIDHGSSGGALFDASGRVVGVNSNISSDQLGHQKYDEVWFKPLSTVKDFLDSNDSKLTPKMTWTGDYSAEQTLSDFRARPLETVNNIAKWRLPEVLLLTNVVPNATAGIPVIGTLGRFARGLATTVAVGGASLDAIGDGYQLDHSSNNRDICRYGLALGADVGVIAGAFLRKRYGPVPMLASMAVRFATDFIPNRQALDSDNQTTAASAGGKHSQVARELVQKLA